MIRINLLPHREEKRKQNKKEFMVMLVLAVVAGGFIVSVIGGGIATRIALQEEINQYIKKENQKLENQILEIATLEQEILALRARQQAVEDLQSDRNQSVYLLDELVLHTPEGVFLKSIKQEGKNIILNGFAQSNERISEFLKNLNSNAKWLAHPELGIIAAKMQGNAKDEKKMFDFTMSVTINRPQENQQGSKNSV